jgi:uncharacterized membrane protein YdbT with pleckstrin-like domain
VAYPEKLLANDEKVVEHLHPHWITLVPATLWFLLICAAGGFGIGLTAGHTNGSVQSVLVGIIVAVGVILLTWLSFRPWLEWRTTHYVFTTHRVLIRRGVLKRTGRDISLQRINDVGFSQTLWERIVKAGTLTIESAGEKGQEDLHDLPRSDQMQQMLNRLIEEDHDRRASVYGSPYPPQQAQQGQPPQQGQQAQQGQPQPPQQSQGPDPTRPYPPQ